MTHGARCQAIISAEEGAMVPKKINIVRAVDCQIAKVFDPHILETNSHS